MTSTMTAAPAVISLGSETSEQARKPAVALEEVENSFALPTVDTPGSPQVQPWRRKKQQASRGLDTMGSATASRIAVATEETLPTIGWLSDGCRCGICAKSVVSRGGVFCGRRREDGSLVGCKVAVCWKCMVKTPRSLFGDIRTTKAEFTSLGAKAWWMHEKCMNLEDMRDYHDVGEDEQCAESDHKEQIDNHAAELDDDGEDRRRGNAGRNNDTNTRFAWE